MDKNYEKYVDEIFNSYNAYHKRNRNKSLDNNTHKKQFSYLIELFKNNHQILKKIFWVLKNYDFHHKSEYGGKHIENLQKELKVKIESLKEVKFDGKKKNGN